MVKSILVLFLSLLTVSSYSVSRKDLRDYYSSVNGLKKEALKTAMHKILKNHTVINYGKGEYGTWGAFYVVDNQNGVVVNRYSDKTFTYSTKGAVPSGMNIEHSFPKSWWGGDKNAAYCDINHLYPSPSDDNGYKANYIMAHVTNVKYDSGVGFDKVGTAVVNGKSTNCWEPGNQYKGDFSRTYMYMAVCYQDLSWTSEGSKCLTSGTYPTLQKWASDLYRTWAKADKVSSLETKRNDDVEFVQGNRNPFIDFPFLMEYIWGDSVDVEFNVNYAVSTALDDTRYGNYVSGNIDSDDEDDDNNDENGNVIFSDDCASQNPAIVVSGNVWKFDSKYGCWVANAYSGSNKKTDSKLTLPVVDLSGVQSPVLSFSHAINFAKGSVPSQFLFVEILCDGVSKVVLVPGWTEGKNWNFIESGNISLDEYAGKKIQVVFHYTSTTSVCMGWEVKDIKIEGQRSTPIIEVEADETSVFRFDANKPYEMYDMTGKRVDESYRGIVVIRQNGHVWKRLKF